MNHSDVPNPFTSAKRISAVSVMLKPSDLVDAWPSLTVAEAERLIDLNGSRIAMQMITAGVNAAIEIIQQEGTES
ncbi:MAG TPA: hypothetical protein VGG19_17080 [Tepidisphaeraceae bacterium]|jgi:hypothetical protein